MDSYPQKTLFLFISKSSRVFGRSWISDWWGRQEKRTTIKWIKVAVVLASSHVPSLSALYASFFFFFLHKTCLRVSKNEEDSTAPPFVCRHTLAIQQRHAQIHILARIRKMEQGTEKKQRTHNIFFFFQGNVNERKFMSAELVGYKKKNSLGWIRFVDHALYNMQWWWWWWWLEAVTTKIYVGSYSLSFFSL